MHIGSLSDTVYRFTRCDRLSEASWLALSRRQCYRSYSYLALRRYYPRPFLFGEERLRSVALRDNGRAISYRPEGSIENHHENGEGDRTFGNNAKMARRGWNLPRRQQNVCALPFGENTSVRNSEKYYFNRLMVLPYTIDTNIFAFQFNNRNDYIVFWIEELYGVFSHLDNDISLNTLSNKNSTCVYINPTENVFISFVN